MNFRELYMSALEREEKLKKELKEANREIGKRDWERRICEATEGILLRQEKIEKLEKEIAEYEYLICVLLNAPPTGEYENSIVDRAIERQLARGN